MRRTAHLQSPQLEGKLRNTIPRVNIRDPSITFPVSPLLQSENSNNTNETEAHASLYACSGYWDSTDVGFSGHSLPEQAVGSGASDPVALGSGQSAPLQEVDSGS